jgi:hypothetical protein
MLDHLVAIKSMTPGEICHVRREEQTARFQHQHAKAKIGDLVRQNPAANSRTDYDHIVGLIGGSDWWLEIAPLQLSIFAHRSTPLIEDDRIGGDVMRFASHVPAKVSAGSSNVQPSAS